MTYITVLAIYVIAMMALAIYFSRRVSSSGDFFVAGRKLGPGLIATTLLAANIGAGSTIGATGVGYRLGLAAWWWVGAAGIGSAILAVTVAPRLWTIAQKNGLYTVGDFLEHRFDRNVRGLASVLLWIGSLIIFAGQLIGGSAILAGVAGINKTVGYVVAASVVTFYFGIGGLHTAVRVNIMQLTVKLIGFLVAVAFLVRASGPGLGSLSPEYLSFTHDGLAIPAFYLATFGPAFVISPGVLQKVFAARSARAARQGVGINAAGLLLFAIVPALLGLYARLYFPALANPEQALPALLTGALPTFIGALLLAAIFAAELSAADAVLFMLTTSLSKDLYQRYINPAADDARLLKVARFTALCSGVAGVFIAIWLETVYAALTVFYTLLTAALVLPVFAGVYWKRVSARSALVSMLVSVAVTFAVHLLTMRKGLWGLPPVLFGLAAGAVAMLVFRGKVTTDLE